MLTSPKEESALAIVIPRNTCELLSLISPQLALSVCGKTGDLLSDCQALDWLFQCIFFPVCLFCDKGHTESEGNLTNRGFPPRKGCQTQQTLDVGKCLRVGRAWQGELLASCAPQTWYFICVSQFTPKPIPYNYRTAKGPNFHFSNVLHFFLLLLRTPLNSTGILKQT